MKKSLFCLLLLAVTVSVFADEDRQTRRVVVDTVWNCSYARANEVIDKFVYELQTDINHLFTWAYVGTEDQGDKKGKDAVALNYVSNTYDPKTRTGVLTLTVDVLGVPWFKNRKVGSIYRDSVVNSTRYARLDITYSGSMLHEANGQFHTTAIDKKHTKVHFELNVVLGKFFSAFITTKKWNDIAAWRIKTMVSNLGEYAETGKVTPKKK